MTALAPDRVAIEGFLAQVGRDAIQLVTFPAAGGPSQARWFGDDAAGATAWAEQRNIAGASVYYSVNVVRTGLNKKASKQDVVAIRYAHVDIDPPKGVGTFDKAAAAAMLRGAVVPPHAIIDSGGGVQALWRVDGLDILAVEAINRSLIAQFGGDPVCWNVDRILRVAGTINHPNEKKRSAGRVPAAATLLGVRDGRTTATELTAAYGATPTPDRADGPAPAALAGGLASLDALGIGAADPLRQLLADPVGDDRSADTYAAACDMHRRGFDADQIAAVFLNPELPISAHCLAQANPERAARRAVERAQAAVEAGGDGFEVLANAHRGAAAINATPYGFPAPQCIPPRRWVYGRQLLRGTLTGIVAPGATGKTALTVGMALAMASGRPLLGQEVHGGPQHCWLFNLEDPIDELHRLIAAGMWAHGLTEADLGGRLFVDSGLSGPGLCTAVQDRHGTKLVQPVFDAITAEIERRRIDWFSLDPWVSSHRAPENDNSAVDAIVKEWARVAEATGCAVSLAHHTAKAAGGEITVDRARGASAFANAARSVLVLNPMTVEEAQRWGIEPGDARRFFRVYNDKSNRAPAAAEVDWHEIVGVDLPNGEGGEICGDSVGVVTRWQPPSTGPAEPLAASITAEVQALIAQGEWRESDRAERWAGRAVAQVLALDPDEKAQRVRVKAVLKELLADGTLAKEERRDATRQMRTWIVVGLTPPAQPADFAGGPVERAAPVSAPVVQPTSALVRGGTKVLHRTSQPPLGGDCRGAVQAGVSIGAKGIGAETAAALPGPNSPVPAISDGSEFL